MDQLDFSSRFQLLDRIADSPIESYQALADTGVVVMAHFIPRELPNLGQFLERVRSLPRAPEGKLMEITAHEGRPVVVTKFILDFESLPAWLDAEVPAAEARTSQPPAGEPTDAPASPTAGPPPAQPPVDEPGDAPAQGPASTDPPVDEPGEFTQMFEALDFDAEPEAAGDSAESRPPPDSPPPAESAEPPPASPPSPPPDTPAVERPEAGSPSSPEPAGGDPAPRDEPGEFTRIFKLSDIQGAGSEADASPGAGTGASSPDFSDREAKSETSDRSDRGRREEPAPSKPRGPDGPPAPAQGPEGAGTDRPAPPPPPPPPSFGGERPTDRPGSGDEPPARDPAARATPPADHPSGSPTETPAGKTPSDENDAPGSFTQEIRRQQPGDARPLGDRDRSDTPGPPPRPKLGDRGTPTPPRRPADSGAGSSSGPSYRDGPSPPLRRGGSGSGSPPPPPGGQSDWRDRLLDAADTTGGSPSGSGAAAPRPDLPRQDGPSDFTRVIRGVRRPGDPGSSAPASPPPAPSSDTYQAPSSSKPIWPLVLGIVLILLVTIGLVVGFWLLGGSGAEAPPPQ